MRLKNVLKTLNPPTNICKRCFQNIETNNLIYLLKPRQNTCYSCFLECVPKFINFKLEGIKCLSIYKYNPKIKELIYKFKGCYDIELASTFLYPYEKELYYLYKDYIVIPIPSYRGDDEARGFNHVEEIFASLNLKTLKLLEKIDKIKQSDRHANERGDIIKYLKVNNLNLLYDKKILIVDDICTTGSTLKAAIKLVKEGRPKDIKVLVLSKRELE